MFSLYQVADGVWFVGKALGKPGWFKPLMEGCSLKYYGGRPNRLSDEHYAWKIIDEVARAVRSVSHKSTRGPMGCDPPEDHGDDGIRRKP